MTAVLRRLTNSREEVVNPMYSAGHGMYLRVSLLSNCNLHCFYCRPPGHRCTSNDISPAARHCEAALSLLGDLGVRKVRFTGGEPTLSPLLMRLIAFTRDFTPAQHIALTSNGLILERLAPLLERAGLDSVNISLDTLNRATYKVITAVDGLKRTIAGIKTAVAEIPEVKLNCVLLRGVNLTEACSLIAFADELGVPLRFIEYMPSTMNPVNNGWYISTDEFMRQLPFTFMPLDSDPASAARYYHASGVNVPIGFISPVSRPFCSACNRLRLAADGRLYHCLFSDRSTDLFTLLDSGRADIAEAAQRFMNAKYSDGFPAAARQAGTLPSFIEMGG